MVDRRETAVFGGTEEILKKRLSHIDLLETIAILFV